MATATTKAKETVILQTPADSARVAKLKALIADWESGKSVQQIAAIHNIAVISVSSEISKLRKAGIPLTKRSPGRHSDTDIGELAAFANSLNGLPIPKPPVFLPQPQVGPRDDATAPE